MAAPIAIKWATSELLEGRDTKAICRLAGCQSSDAEVNELLLHALDEVGVSERTRNLSISSYALLLANRALIDAAGTLDTLRELDRLFVLSERREELLPFALLEDDRVRTNAGEAPVHFPRVTAYTIEDTVRREALRLRAVLNAELEYGDRP